jgi:hypothetical protein
MHVAMAMKTASRIQSSTFSPSTRVIQPPTAPVQAWLMRVEMKMPMTIGTGFQKRAASRIDHSWVLSLISARATMPVGTRKASMLWWCPGRVRTNDAPFRVSSVSPGASPGAGVAP